MIADVSDADLEMLDTASVILCWVDMTANLMVAKRYALPHFNDFLWQRTTLTSGFEFQHGISF